MINHKNFLFVNIENLECFQQKAPSSNEGRSDDGAEQGHAAPGDITAHTMDPVELRRAPVSNTGWALRWSIVE